MCTSELYELAGRVKALRGLLELRLNTELFNFMKGEVSADEIKAIMGWDEHAETENPSQGK